MKQFLLFFMPKRTKELSIKKEPKFSFHTDYITALERIK